MSIRPFHLGVLASILVSLTVHFGLADLLERPREAWFDTLTQTVMPPLSDRVVVVDIDRKTIQPRPEQAWSRADTADLVGKVAAGRPAVMGFDLVFSTRCDGNDPVNRTLAANMAKAPSVLGFLLAEAGNARPLPQPPLTLAKSLSVPDSWFIEAVEVSCPVFQASAASSAASFLFGDGDARVRRVLAYSIVGSDPYPALATEAVRIAGKDGAPILGGTPPWLKVGNRILALTEDGAIRFVASDLTRIAARTISAGDVVAGLVPPSRFEGKIVLFGSSLPNLGGLRESAAEPLVASVQIHADLVNALMTGTVPVRDTRIVPWEAFASLALGLLVALVASRSRPPVMAAAGLSLIAVTIGASVLIYARTAMLTDAMSIALSLALVLVVAAFVQFAHVRRAERIARERFSQYLPQSVVARYIDNPDAARIAGEEREVTALFTDIEGFSTLAKRVGARELVGLLDIYYGEVTRLISDHGGMIDKIVGDAVHAMFNAPEDLADHVDQAIRAALAIEALTEAMRLRPDFAKAGFGRTRIGIETGMAVLGEVGAGGKLDYTAHGDAVNLAARLQDANKMLGTSICIGPEAARRSRLPMSGLGDHEIRGFGTMALYSPSASPGLSQSTDRPTLS